MHLIFETNNQALDFLNLLVLSKKKILISKIRSGSCSFFGRKRCCIFTGSKIGKTCIVYIIILFFLTNIYVRIMHLFIFLTQFPKFIVNSGGIRFKFFLFYFYFLVEEKDFDVVDHFNCKFSAGFGLKF